MSVYQRFATVDEATAAFRVGTCRRHVEVDGHVIDLVQHAAEVVRAKLRAAKEAERQAVPEARTYTDAEVAANVAAALASEAGVVPAAGLDADGNGNGNPEFVVNLSDLMRAPFMREFVRQVEQAALDEVTP